MSKKKKKNYEGVGVNYTVQLLKHLAIASNLNLEATRVRVLFSFKSQLILIQKLNGWKKNKRNKEEEFQIIRKIILDFDHTII